MAVGLVSLCFLITLFFMEFTTQALDNGNGFTIAVVSEEFYVVDEQRIVFSESPLADSKAVFTLELAENGTPCSC